MRIRGVVLWLCLSTAPALAQREVPTINTETPEGQLLQQIGQEENDAKKAALMEQFIAKYPAHEAAVWVYSLMVATYTKTGQFDQALAAGEKVLAADPSDLHTAHATLKAAEAKKDPEAVRDWALRVSALARKVASAPKSKDEDEDEYKQRVDFAKQLDTYTAYSLFAAGLQASDPRQKAALFRALEENSPDSEYVAQSRDYYFLALTQSGDTAAAAALAEKSAADGKAGEEMLAFLGDYYLRQNKELGKVSDYANKLVQLVSTRPKPEGVSEEDWQKRKNQLLGLGYWMAGSAAALQNQFAEADKSLRAALPYIAGNNELRASALFHLGVANYRLGKIVDAIKFNQECIAIKSPYQAQAQKNLKAIQAEYRVVR
jgi:tetratricopeptide (TPR) repeat protein